MKQKLVFKDLQKHLKAYNVMPDGTPLNKWFQFVLGFALHPTPPSAARLNQALGVKQKENMMIGKIISGLLGGLIVAILGAMLVTLALASNPESGGLTGAMAFFIFWVVALIIALAAPRAGKAWRRLLITSGLLAFAMPISSLIFAGAQVADAASQGGEYAGAAAAGATLGGGMVTAITGFLGFFLGVIFLVIGLLVGRDKQIVIITES